MDLKVYAAGGDKKGHTIPLPNPHHTDAGELAEKVRDITSQYGLNIEKLDVVGLIPRMIKGVSGCERGCAGNAKGLVADGHPGFELEYGDGILTAKGGGLTLRLYPEC